MKKVILILLFVLFYQNNVKAQSSISVIITGDCSYLSGTYTYNGLLNGKNSYIKSIIIDGENGIDVGITFDTTNWVLSVIDDITNVGFINSSVPDGLLPPFTGWVNTGCPDGTMIIEEDLSANDFESFDNKIAIHPNPSKSFIIFENTKSTNNSFEYNIMDFVGRIVAKGHSKPNEKIFIENLLDGNYIVEIISEFGEVTRKKIIKN